MPHREGDDMAEPVRVAVVDDHELVSLAMELGLLDTSLPLDSARVRYRVNERSKKYLADPLYSVRIREP